MKDRRWSFGNLSLGDMFNTKAARWVKISNEEAICVCSSIFPIGQIQHFSFDNDDIVILYSSVLEQT